ncbi:MAG: hypothetical protein AMJ79_06090 [Phycisphaerae bacterium SM23_30]|nr:MAG: hypothetical protein AMJ79_06090 [Phycisphaerae bacterium SM23_30]
MKAKKLLIWTWVGLVLLVFTGAARADSFFDILTPADWEENLYAGHLRTMTELEWGDYMFDWNNPDFVEGEPYLFNEYQSPGLYVYEGSDPDWPDDSGLVMYWGNEDLPTGSYSAAWMYDYKEDPDLSNSTITITVVPPQFDPALIPPSQINVVSVGMQDINGNKRAWYWNCPVPIAWNIPTKITINTAMAGPGAANPAASSYMSNPLFDITKVQFIIVDENAQWVGGGKPVPLPGTTVAKPWNLWENLSVNPNPTNPIAAGINIDIHQDISPNDTGGVLPNDFHIEGSIESGDPNDPAIPGSGEWSDPPVLTKHIDFDGMFPFFKYKIVPDPSKPGENWYKFVADWYGAEIPHCHILHLGLEPSGKWRIYTHSRI